MVERRKPQNGAASTAEDGGMTQGDICLNSAQIRHERNKHHLQIKGKFHPDGTGYCLDFRWP